MLRYQVENGTAVLTLDEPDRRNPLTTDTMAALADAVGAARDDAAVRVIIVTGAGDQAFCAGGDLSGGFVESPLPSHESRRALADLFRAMRQCGKPIIARVNGHALAGGFGLAIACDIVISVENATFGATEVKVGLWPMMIGALLQRTVPQKAALDLMMTGRRISAHRAMELGAVSRVVPAHELDGAVDEAVAELTAISPAVLAMGKHAFYATEDMSLDVALDHLHNGLTAVAMTEDATEGISAFMEKRDPEWNGR